MKKRFMFLLGLLISLSTSICSAQNHTYKPLPKSNALWNAIYYDNGSCSSNPTTLYVSYTVEKDTVIQGKAYIKLGGNSKLGMCPGGTSYSTPCNSRLLYEDTVQHRIYARCDNGTDTLLYDFDLQIGDTIKSALSYNAVFIVEMVDSIELTDGYHRALYAKYDGAGTNIFTTIIEGIGSNRGLLEPLFAWEAGAILNCMKHNGVIIYGVTSSTCDIVSSIDSYESTDYSILPFPNPAVTEVTFTLGSLAKGQTNVIVKIYNSVGHEIKQIPHTIQSGNTTSVSITCEDLPNDIYYYTVFSSKDFIRTGKFVVCK